MKSITEKPKSFIAGSLMFSVLILLSFTAVKQNPDWVVPGQYQNMENPTTADGESLAIAKSLWSKHCKSCHGKKGLGDGPKAAELDTPCGDFSSDEFQNQTDGALFYKTTVGKDDMPKYDSKIPDDEDRWHLVNLMRTF